MEIKVKKINFKATLVTVLAVILSMAVLCPMALAAAEGIEQLTAGNVTEGNVTSGNVTSGNVTSGNLFGVYTLKKTEDGNILALVGMKVKALLDCGEIEKVLNADGTEADEDALLATGMKLVIDGEEAVLVVLCDVSGDGKCTAKDAREMLRASVDLRELNEYELLAGDIVQDGKPKAKDARMLLRTSVELEEPEELFVIIK